MLPIFKTDRLILRQRTMADFQACLEMDSDVEVMKFISVPWNGPQAHELFVRDRIESSFGDGMGY